MSTSITESKGIWSIGRLAYCGVFLSVAFCFGKVALIAALIMFGASEKLDFNPHIQAAWMVVFALIGVWGMKRDARQHGDARPFWLGVGGLVLLVLTIYGHYHKSFEFMAYMTLVISVFWNQNIALKHLAGELRESNAEIEHKNAQLRERNAEIERKNAQLEQASQMKSKFLAAMSHELRTPLNAVIGFSEVLDARMFGEMNEKQSEYVKDIHEAGHHLLALINDILDLSKIEAGRMALEQAEFDLPQMLESATLLIQGRAANHGLTLKLDVDERLGGIVGDERKLKQVLINLLTNAVKFTPDGGRIELKATPVGDGTVEIAVKDTGVGIAPEEQATIFEEFHQACTADGHNQEGLGLGLALSKRFVEMHEGTIRVQSQPDQGSTFTVTLPLQPCPAS